MVFPTYLIVPPLFFSFAVLVFLFWRASPRIPLLDLRFLMMAGAIIVMLVQVALSGFYPAVSEVCFVLAMIWLAASLLLLRRYIRQG